MEDVGPDALFWPHAHTVPPPVPVAGVGGAGFLERVRMVSGGGEFSASVDGGAEGITWGANDEEQLGNGGGPDQPVPGMLADFDPIPPPQGNVLMAVKQYPHVNLDWSTASALKWFLYHEQFNPYPFTPAEKAMIGTFRFATLFSPNYLHSAAVVLGPELYTYRIRAASPFCEIEVP